MNKKKLNELQLLSELPIKRLMNLKTLYSKFAKEATKAGHEEDAAMYKAKLTYLSKAIQITKRTHKQALG